MPEQAQRPLQLILARNFLTNVSTPALLVNQPGDVIFYNDAAGTLLGRRFEETGTLSASDWVQIFGPLDEHGEPIPLERQPLTAGLRANRPGHTSYRIRVAEGGHRAIGVTGLPILTGDGFQGAMVFFWPLEEVAG